MKGDADEDDSSLISGEDKDKNKQKEKDKQKDKVKDNAERKKTRQTKTTRINRKG